MCLASIRRLQSCDAAVVSGFGEPRIGDRHSATKRRPRIFVKRKNGTILRRIERRDHIIMCFLVSVLRSRGPRRWDQMKAEILIDNVIDSAIIDLTYETQGTAKGPAGRGGYALISHFAGWHWL